MSFDDWLQQAAKSPTVRHEGCTCGPLLGDWDRNCALHPHRESGLVVEEAIRGIFDSHDIMCVGWAREYARELGTDLHGVRFIAAQVLADGQIECVCKTPRAAAEMVR